jgi:ribosomal protein S18 acetylase RimI-like enzyme
MIDEGASRAGPDVEHSNAADIVPARPDDARAIAEVHVASWRQAYADQLPAAYLASLSVTDRETMWRELLQAGRAQVTVARAGESIVGFAACGACRDDAAPAGRMELWALYLAPPAWSRGIGRALWQAVEAQLRAQHAASVSLWVIASNERARRFYSAAGFEIDPGSQNTFTLGGVELQEVRMVRRLAG